MNVSIVNDQLLEVDEVFTVYLSLVWDSPADLGYVQLGPTSASITIIDDDGNNPIACRSCLLYTNLCNHNFY